MAESPAHGLVIERPETKQYGNEKGPRDQRRRRPAALEAIERRYITSNVSYTVTLPPPCRMGQPFARPAAESSESAVTIV